MKLFEAYRGIYIFRVHGHIYYYVNRYMSKNKMPCYIQLYFYDTNKELQNRMKITENFVEFTFIILIVEFTLKIS